MPVSPEMNYGEEVAEEEEQPKGVGEATLRAEVGSPIRQQLSPKQSSSLPEGGFDPRMMNTNMIASPTNPFVSQDMTSIETRQADKVKPSHLITDTKPVAWTIGNKKKSKKRSKTAKQ